jgi:hypothetical protein
MKNKRWDAVYRSPIENDDGEFVRIVRYADLEAVLKPYLAIVEALEPQLIGCSREQELAYKNALVDLRQFWYSLST